MKRILSLCFGTVAFVSLNAQCALIEVPLQQRVNASTLIVEGRVIEQQSFWNTTHTMIYTANTIELYKVFKGDVATTSIQVITEGGTVDLNRIEASTLLHLHVGEVGMFTCTPVVRAKNLPGTRGVIPRFEAYASAQGFVKYDEVNQVATDPFRTYADIQTELYDVCSPVSHNQYRTVKPYDLMNSVARQGDETQAGLSITSIAPTTLTAGTGSVLTINGTGFGAVQGTGSVGFKNADDGGATFINPLATQYVSWTTTQIQVIVPASAGTGVIQVINGSSQSTTSSQTLTITYAEQNVEFDPGTGTEAFQTDHVNNDGNGGYTWRMNTGFDADAAASAAFTRAFDNWRCNTGIHWEIGATTSVNDAVSDGTNVICYDNASPLSAGILGVCYSYWSGCASGPTIVWFVSELDIIFDEGSNIFPLTWNFGPQAPTSSEYDFESVTVHELGHGHQLGHVISPGAIMHYALSNGTSNRTPGVDDLAGANDVESRSEVANVCGAGPMVHYSCGSLPVASFSGSPTTVCEGGSVTFTDQSSGTPTSWTWLFPGGTPSSSNSQNPTVAYNTPGTYDVSLTVTNSVGSNSLTITGYITVNALPSVSFTSNPAVPAVCAGSQITLSGTGAQSYSWSGGIADGVPFTPESSGSYSVTGIDVNGCENTAVATVTVNPVPTLTVTSTPSNGIVCAGNQATLTASGAQSYSWTGGISNGVAFTPAATTTYTVTGTGSNGCTSTASSTITVQSCSSATTTVPCGITITNKSQSASAVAVSGATQYRFSFYDNSTLALVGQRTQGSRTLVFNNVSNIFYGNTYRWTVAVNTGSGFGAESSMNCTVTLAAPKTTLPCGQTYNRYNGYSAAPAIFGAAGYRFTFYDNSTNAVVTQLTQTSNYIYFSGVPNLMVGATYKWTIEVQYDNGSGLVFGPSSPMSCVVTMSPPKATVPCGGTYNQTTGYSACTYVQGATGYRFTFYQNSVQVAQLAQTSNYIHFNQVSGISNGNTYTWTVEVQYNNGSGLVYGPASTRCYITFSSSARLSDAGIMPDQLDETPAMFSFAMLMYPNPLGNGVAPSVNITGADQQTANVTVVDVNGRVVTSYVLQVEGDDYTTELTDFPELVSGMYIMQVQIGDQVQSQRFIAE